MARRSAVRRVEEFILFDVLYEDGTRTSNRKVPGSELGQVEGDLHVQDLYRGAGPGNLRRSPENRGPRSGP
jgi:hypothetical protein